MFAQYGSSAVPAGMETTVLLIILVAVVIGVAIAVLLVWLLYDACKRIPAQYRELEPWQVWLLLIPVWSLIWNFVVYPRLSRSMQAALAAQGTPAADDCGAQLGLYYAICCVVALVPIVGGIAGLAGLVIWIMYLVKISGLKKGLPPAMG